MTRQEGIARMLNTFTYKRKIMNSKHGKDESSIGISIKKKEKKHVMTHLKLKKMWIFYQRKRK